MIMSFLIVGILIYVLFRMVVQKKPLFPEAYYAFKKKYPRPVGWIIDIVVFVVIVNIFIFLSENLFF